MAKRLSWRNEKLNAVAEARRRGVNEEEIFRQLKIAGLIDATARAIMKDASYLEHEEMPTELTPSELQEELNEENQNRIALGKKPYTLEQWKKIRKPRMKVE
jgi:transposase-like protein